MNILSILIIGGAIVGGYYYKDEILEWIKKLTDGDGPTPCTKTCTTGEHLDTVNCECVPDTCTKTCPAGEHIDNTCNCVADDPGPGPGPGPDPTPTATQWFQANGETKSMPNARCDGESNRWENVVSGFMDVGFEVVVYWSVPKGSMKGERDGSHIGLKHGGPNHGSGCQYKSSGPCGGGSDCCCWWDGGLRRNGDPYLEIEAPHPSNCRTKFYPNIGRPLDNGQPLGVRWHIRKEGGGVRLRQWVDTSGQVGAFKWKETYNFLDTGQLMPKSYIDKITNVQNIEIRISDVACKSIKMLLGPTSRKITGSSSSSLTPTATRIPFNYYDRFADLVANPRFVV